ncbi:MAG: type transport system permease protein [Chloroflexota bacterium]|jgi:ABC-type transport system involved in multi-copper enzyme maturation permease subunit|nr:type transport system permease protein [Chloroflexota bacterium]
MTALATGIAQRGGRIGGRIGHVLGRFWSGISAVSIKELRGRMRGRRAFVVLTIYLMLLGLFAFAIYVYLKQQAATATLNNSGGFFPPDTGFPGWPTGQTLSNGTALSAGIGHGIFGGLLFLETLLVLVLAPAFTTGAISLEREKQTLDLLVTTPLSTLGMVIGKLFSALVYVFLLIIASIPLASLVFVFGAVGPDDLVRAYVFLFALAFGMGALGLFVSAVVKRTQTATVITFVLVLVLSIGTAAAHQFWQVAARSTTGSSGLLLTSRSGRAPEALLWFNPFVSDLDMVCATAPDTYHESCAYISSITGRPYFGSPTNGSSTPPIFRGGVLPMPQPGGGGGVIGGGVVIDDVGGVGIAPESAQPVANVAIDCPPNARCGAPADTGVKQAMSFGFPRDTFWPKSAAAFVGLGLVLTLLAAQLVSPTRRLRFSRPKFRRPQPPKAIEPDSPAAVENAS